MEMMEEEDEYEVGRRGLKAEDRENGGGGGGGRWNEGQRRGDKNREDGG